MRIRRWGPIKWARTPFIAWEALRCASRRNGCETVSNPLPRPCCEACLSSLVGLAVAALVVGCFWGDGRDLHGAQLVVHRDEREVRGEDVAALEGLEVLRQDLHADLHAGAPGAVDGGLEDQDVAVAGGGVEADGIDAEREARAAGV